MKRIISMLLAMSLSAVLAGCFDDSRDEVSGANAAVASLIDAVPHVANDNFSVEPYYGTIGTIISISGTAFGTSEGKISIGGKSATVQSWSDTAIDVKVARSLAPGTYDIVLTTADGRSIVGAQAFTIMAPVITEVDPSQSGIAGDAVVIRGYFFGHKAVGSQILLRKCVWNQMAIERWTMDAKTGESECAFTVPNLAADFYDLHIRNGVAKTEKYPGGYEIYTVPTYERKYYDGSVTIASEADIAALSGYTDISGDVDIIASSLKNLRGLESIQKVEGTVRIFNNANLESLEGLRGLTNIGETDLDAGIDIRNNPVLKNLHGLENLKTVSAWLYVYNNSALKSVSALTSLVCCGSEEAGGVAFSSNAVLTDFGTIFIPGAIVLISKNSLLESLSGVTVEPKYTLTISENPRLRNVPRCVVSYIDGVVEIKNNALLTDLDGFISLTRVGALSIIGNATLDNLNGFGSLTKCWGGLWDSAYFRVQNNISLPESYAWDLFNRLSFDDDITPVISGNKQ